MATWRFYQGLRAEWRWYQLDERGTIIAESDQGFEELRSCMANAEAAGFAGSTYQVHARQAGTYAEPDERRLPELQEPAPAPLHIDTPDEQAAT